MSELKDGGPAFPTVGGFQDPHIQASETGMSLRDYFAAKALQGATSDPSYGGNLEELTKWCYAAADAMLKARSEP